MADAVRMGCRVCGGLCAHLYTVCKTCSDLVFEATGGLGSTNIRAYLKSKAKPAKPKTPRPIVKRKFKNPPIRRKLEKNIRCGCGALYTREIAVLSCESRGHKPLARKEGDNEKVS